MGNTQKEYREMSVAVNEVTQNSRFTNIDLSKEILAMTLSDKGIITSCNGACARLLGCTPSEIKFQHISTFLPEIQEENLFKDNHVNPRLCFLSHIGYHFQVVKSNGMFFAGKVIFVELANTGEYFVRVIIRPV